MHRGVNRSAAVALAYLMASAGCTLEDAYFYLESVRPAVHVSRHLLQQLSNYEAEVFGRKLTNLDDLDF
ncbi:Dual specificity protein phosphatase 18 [Amphibalanus amphitrite]|uniref:protein-tyrosine-phosphatase n=1 Tax=Amphibalanus amphitrite TaxID=1232801 RepID=A0A6A4XCX3_AMPAM|nr:Dual specificity protein phosphatase 18 [Amphibalanus amphitrite]